ncbi:MAG: hydrolase [Arenicellales bacterium]
MRASPAVQRGPNAPGPVVIESDFRAAPWCRGPHLQTLWPYLFRRHPKPQYRRDRLELPDGDFIDLDWLGPSRSSALAVVLHGLEGSSSSHYVRALSQALSERGIAVVVMHQRGCSGEPNRLARFYHAGETSDFQVVLRHCERLLPDARRYAVGYSLGGNILLKWLGESGTDSLLRGAVAVSVPFLLEVGARRLERGASRLYQAYLIRSMKRSVAIKRRRMPHPIEDLVLSRCSTFEEIDTCLTAPLHGFLDAHDYYERSSCRPFLHRITTQTLILHARDDPFMTPEVIPGPHELSASIRLELSRSGGHCGFVSGPSPLRPHYWLDRRIPDFIESHMKHDGGLRSSPR